VFSDITPNVIAHVTLGYQCAFCEMRKKLKITLKVGTQVARNRNESKVTPMVHGMVRNLPVPQREHNTPPLEN
jgi:hypothetical protein